jgi:transposase-like protein
MATHARRNYDAEFKRQAVHLSLEEGRTVSGVAESLGINKDLIYQWRKQLKRKGELAFPGNGKQLLTEEQQRIKDLEKKLKDAELERDILKKALAIFSQAQ